MNLHLSHREINPSLCNGKVTRLPTSRRLPEGKTTDSQSIFKMLEQVMQQVEYNCFVDLRLNRIDPLYEEICLIIAEVLVLDKDSTIKINGSHICTRLVQEIYLKINNEHVRLVVSNFNNYVTQHIFNKKAYMRTALYNVVFEIEAHYVNINDMSLD